MAYRMIRGSKSGRGEDPHAIHDFTSCCSSSRTRRRTLPPIRWRRSDSNRRPPACKEELGAALTCAIPKAAGTWHNTRFPSATRPLPGSLLHLLPQQISGVATAWESPGRSRPLSDRGDPLPLPGDLPEEGDEGWG